LSLGMLLDGHMRKYDSQLFKNELPICQTEPIGVINEEDKSGNFVLSMPLGFKSQGLNAFMQRMIEDEFFGFYIDFCQDKIYQNVLIDVGAFSSNFRETMEDNPSLKIESGDIDEEDSSIYEYHYVIDLPVEVEGIGSKLYIYTNTPKDFQMMFEVELGRPSTWNVHTSSLYEPMPDSPCMYDVIQEEIKVHKIVRAVEDDIRETYHSQKIEVGMVNNLIKWDFKDCDDEHFQRLRSKSVLLHYDMGIAERKIAGLFRQFNTLVKGSFYNFEAYWYFISRLYGAILFIPGVLYNLNEEAVQNGHNGNTIIKVEKGYCYSDCVYNINYRMDHHFVKLSRILIAYCFKMLFDLKVTGKCYECRLICKKRNCEHHKVKRIQYAISNLKDYLIFIDDLEYTLRTGRINKSVQQYLLNESKMPPRNAVVVFTPRWLFYCLKQRPERVMEMIVKKEEFPGYREMRSTQKLVDMISSDSFTSNILHASSKFFKTLPAYSKC
jgi:hypothetical protein